MNKLRRTEQWNITGLNESITEGGHAMEEGKNSEVAEPKILGIDFRTKENQEHLHAALKDALRILAEVHKSGQFDSWLVKVLVGLIQTVKFSYTNVITGSQDESIAFCAWCARSLLEAEIWMEYVTASTSNARRFYSDWVNDVTEMLDCSVPYSELNPQQQADMSLLFEKPETDSARVIEARAMLEGFRNSSETDDEDYLRVAAVAKELGHGKWFSKYNKVLSKHVHTTAFSVLSFPSEKARTNLSNFLLHEASNSCIRSLNWMNLFFKRNDLPVMF
jgi:hypothetical protein